MKFAHYQKFALAGLSLAPDTYRERLMLSGMGLAGEAGEVCDHTKKVAFHSAVMDKDALLKELGDVLWYYSLLLSIHSLTLDDVMEANVHKLCARYSSRHGSPEDVIAGKAV